MIILMALQSAS